MAFLDGHFQEQRREPSLGLPRRIHEAVAQSLPEHHGARRLAEMAQERQVEAGRTAQASLRIERIEMCKPMGEPRATGGNHLIRLTAAQQKTAPGIDRLRGIGRAHHAVTINEQPQRQIGPGGGAIRAQTPRRVGPIVAGTNGTGGKALRQHAAKVHMRRVLSMAIPQSDRQRQRMTPPPIRVGICGLGRSGRNIHARTIGQLAADFQVVAVHDIDAQRLAATAAELQATPHASFTALIGDPAVDLVVIASYNGFHAEQAAMALAAGKHTLCDKPIGLTAADVERLIHVAAASQRTFAPFQQRRYQADFQKVRDVIASGVLGRIHSIHIHWHGFKRRWDWQTSRATHGGALNNNGPHPIDHALELIGASEPHVWCIGERVLCSGDAEDHLQIVLSQPGHPTVMVELSDAIAYGQPRWVVSGSHGGLTGSDRALSWKWVDSTAMPPRPLDFASTPDRSYNSETLTWREDTWACDQDPVADCALAFYRDLARGLRSDGAPPIDPQSVLRNMVLLERCRAQIAAHMACTSARI